MFLAKIQGQKDRQEQKNKDRDKVILYHRMIWSEPVLQKEVVLTGKSKGEIWGPSRSSTDTLGAIQEAAIHFGGHPGGRQTLQRPPRRPLDTLGAM